MRYLFAELPPDLQSQLAELSRDGDNPQVHPTETRGLPAAQLVVGGLVVAVLVVYVLQLLATRTTVIGVVGALITGALLVALLGVQALVRLSRRGPRPSVILASPLVVRTGTAAEAVDFFRLDEVESDAFGSAEVVFRFRDGELRCKAGPEHRGFFRSIRQAAEDVRRQTLAAQRADHPWERLLPPAAPTSPPDRRLAPQVAAVLGALVAGPAIAVAAWAGSAQRWERHAWSRAERTPPTSAGYAAYLAAAAEARDVLPGPVFAASGFGAREATAREREDDLAWGELRTRGAAGIGEYLARYPEGRHGAEARAAYDERRFQEATTPGALRAYLKDLPAGAHAAAAKQRLDELLREAQQRLEGPGAPEDALALRAGLARVLAAAREAGAPARLVLVRGAEQVMDSAESEAELRAELRAMQRWRDSAAMKDVLRDRGSMANMTRGFDSYEAPVRSQQVVNAVKAAFEPLPAGLFELVEGDAGQPAPRLRADHVVLPSGTLYEFGGLGLPGMGMGSYFPGIVVSVRLTLELADGTTHEVELLAEPSENLSVKTEGGGPYASLLGKAPDTVAVYRVMFGTAVSAFQAQLGDRLR